jgi:Flp pilus assembly protein TadG
MRIQRPLRGRRLGEQGQSLLEMALVLPMLLALVIGIVELGRAWNVRQVITNAAREGARLAVVNSTPDEDTVQAAVESRLEDAGLDPGTATIEIDRSGGIIGQLSTVNVSYPHTFLFLGPVVDLLTEDASGIPGSITIASTARMRNE